MEFKDFVFYVLSFVLIASGLSVITSRNPVTAALSLVLAFFNAAGFYYKLNF
jgi:NADH-quinone oxidoreductase subunit J